MRKAFTQLAIGLLLRLNGFRLCRLSDGRPGWNHKQDRRITGGTRWAASNMMARLKIN